MVSGYLLSLNGDIDDPYAIVNEQLADDYGWYKLSLKNCEAIERGYDLDELANELLYSKYPFHPSNDSGYWLDMYKEGFQKCLELMGDKKFSEDDVKNIFTKTLENAPSTESHTRMISDVEYRHSVMDELYDRVIKSLQKTEWDVEVEIEEEKEFIFDPTMGISQGHYLDKPKLDENGCVILKKNIRNGKFK